MHYMLILIALALAGCESGPALPEIPDPPKPEPPLAAPPIGSGTARVSGKLTLRTSDFGPQPVGGQEVSLVPQTAETDALMTSHYGRSGVAVSAFPSEKLPSNIRSARLRARTDKKGSFVFRKVPAGSWIAAGCMRWQRPGQYVPEGGCVIKRFRVAKGQRLRLRLSQ